VAWGIVGAVGAYGCIMVLAVNRPESLRGDPLMSFFDARENDRMLDLCIAGIVAGIVGVIALARRRLRLPWSFLVGQALGVAMAVIIILCR